jgi:hypothetical protein
MNSQNGRLFEEVAFIIICYLLFDYVLIAVLYYYYYNNLYACSSTLNKRVYRHCFIVSFDLFLYFYFFLVLRRHRSTAVALRTRHPSTRCVDVATALDRIVLFAELLILLISFQRIALTTRPLTCLAKSFRSIGTRGFVLNCNALLFVSGVVWLGLATDWWWWRWWRCFVTST